METVTGQVTQIHSDEGLWHQVNSTNPLPVPDGTYKLPYFDVYPDKPKALITHPIIRLKHNIGPLTSYGRKNGFKIKSKVECVYKETDRSDKLGIIYGELISITIKNGDENEHRN